MKKFTALFFLLLHAAAASACTTFLLAKDGRYYFGRNYDWITGNGVVLVNGRDLQKSSLPVPDGASLSWRSLYGSLTFNQYGKEFPTGGMNEKGLVVELMWLDETRYADRNGQPALSELQWIQYQLDCAATVDDVVRSLPELRISASSVPLHFLVADATGAAATIEFLDGKPVVHRGASLPFPVLANAPYAASLPAVTSGAKGSSSNGRFATACTRVQEYAQTSSGTPPVDYAFSVLNEVAQGAYTKWRIVYDINGRLVHFVSGNGDRKSVSLSSMDLGCGERPRFLPMDEGAGDRTGFFMPFSAERNRELIERSARESRSLVEIPAQQIEAALKNGMQPSCAGK